MPAVAALIVLGIIAYAMTRQANATATGFAPNGFDDLYRYHAALHGLDWRLLKAIAVTESGENPNAVNPSDPSYGLCQILCTGAEGDQLCTNRLNVPSWSGATPNRLMDPAFNVQVAAEILAWNIGQFGTDKGIAVYNMWAAYKTPAGSPFPNQEYVDRVKANWGVA